MSGATGRRWSGPGPAALAPLTVPAPSMARGPLTVLVTAALTVVAASGCAVGSGSGSSAGRSGTVSRPVGPSASVRALTDLFPGARVTELPATLGDRLTLALGRVTADGTALGTTTALSPSEIESFAERQSRLGRAPSDQVYDPSEAVLVDPGTHRVGTVHRPDAGWTAFTPDADPRTVAGLDVYAAGPHGDDGSEAGWRVWCLDRASGRTTVLRSHEPGQGVAEATPEVSLDGGRVLIGDAATTWAYDGCRAAGRTVPAPSDTEPVTASVRARLRYVDTPEQTRYTLELQDSGGARRLLLDAVGLDARADAAGAAWLVAGAEQVAVPLRVARWGEPPVTVPPALSGRAVAFELTFPAERAFTLEAVDTSGAGGTSGSGDPGAARRALVLDPVTGALADLAGPGGAPGTRVLDCRGRFVLVSTGPEDTPTTGYRLVDLGTPAPAPPPWDRLTLPSAGAAAPPPSS